jgi:hypothetical protein
VIAALSERGRRRGGLRITKFSDFAGVHGSEALGLVLAGGGVGCRRGLLAACRGFGERTPDPHDL